MVHLAKLKNLRWLDLACCEKITDAGLTHLAGMKELRSLDVCYCDKITEAGIQSLKTALPDCDVGF